MEFNKGDCIVCVEPPISRSENVFLREGNIYVISDIRILGNNLQNLGIFVEQDKTPSFWMSSRFVPYNEENYPNTKTFKKGDKVRCIAVYHEDGFHTYGDIYTVCDMSKGVLTDFVLLRSKENNETVAVARNFELVKENIMVNFNVGDSVRCIDAKNSSGLLHNGSHYIVKAFDVVGGDIKVGNISNWWVSNRFELSPTSVSVAQEKPKETKSEVDVFLWAFKDQISKIIDDECFSNEEEDFINSGNDEMMAITAILGDAGYEVLVKKSVDIVIKKKTV